MMALGNYVTTDFPGFEKQFLLIAGGNLAVKKRERFQRRDKNFSNP